MRSKSRSFDQWREIAAGLRIETRAFIDGEYVDAASGDTLDVISPVDGRRIGSLPDCGPGEIDRAVAAAKRAFESRVWSGQTPTERRHTLLRLADLVDENRDELAVLETLDSGKTIRESLDMDMLDVAIAIRYYAEAIDKIHGQIAPTGDGFHGMITREPFGVVGAMTPWNNPLMIASWKVAPALATGNSLVLKPSQKSSLTAIRLAQLACDAGVPAGVFNVVTGGGAVGEALTRHNDVGMLSFTGSTGTAKKLQVYSGESNLKSLVLEGGGKNAHIVFCDAPDLEKVARAAAAGFCANQGEVCASGTRLLVEASIHDRFLELLIAEVEKYRPGHPLDPETNMGALIDEGHLTNVQRYVDSARAEGATIAIGGRRVLQDELGGAYFLPTVITDASPQMTAVREEIFGPVGVVLKFSTEEEAIQLANDSEYGLAAGFWTPDLVKAHRVARRLQAGTVWVNHYLTRNILSPFGGYKQSGYGRDESLYALDAYTQIKSTFFALDDVPGHEA